MNKKVISLLICFIIVFVSSTPIDRTGDGGKLTNSSNISYTESPKTTGPIVNTLANVASQQIDGVHADNTEAPSAISTNISSSSTVTHSIANTDPTPTENPDTTTSSQPPTTTSNTTTSTATIPTTTKTAPTTTITPTTVTPPASTTSPETTKHPTTSTSATTTAAAATTTVPTPTASPSKDRRFDGPSFIGGIVLSLGIMAIGFVAFKFYKARTERNYHTL